MPFDVRCSGHERYIVQVEDLPLESVGAVEYTREKEGASPSAAIRIWAKRVSAYDP